MKRLLLPVFALAFSALAPQLLRAQDTLPELLGEDDDNTTQADSSDGPQRIGIPAADFEIEPSQTGSIAGYCFDEHLIAPMRLTTFENVLAGGDATVRTADGRTRTLREAVKKGEIDIKAHQLSVMFVNRTDQPMQVNLAKPTVLWDRPAGQINPLALSALDAKGVSYDQRQKAIWRVTSSERRLKGLGYLAGSIYDFDRERYQSAMNAFQRDNGLATTSDLDLATVNSIATKDAALRDRLRSLGFATREGRFAKEDLGSQVRSYEKFLGKTPTGRWNGELATTLASTETVIPQLNAIRPAKGQQIADVLAANENGTVLTYLNGARGLMLLAETPSGVELWNRSGRSYQFAGRDADAVRSIDAAAAQLARRASKENRVVIYPGVAEDGIATVTVGNGSVDVDARELAAFVKGGAIPKSLENALATLVPQPSSNEWTGGNAALRTFVVYRSPLQQGQGARSLERLGLEQVDGGKLAGALDRTYGSRMALFVSDDLRAGAQRFDPSMGSLRDEVRRSGLSLAD